MLYWGSDPGERPNDHIRQAVPDVSRRAVAFVLEHGKDAHPEIQAAGWANCRLCGAALGSRDLTAFGYVWPEKAEHYVSAHGVWTPECDAILHCVLSSPPVKAQ